MVYNLKDMSTGYILSVDPGIKVTGFFILDDNSKTETCYLNLSSLKCLRSIIELEIDRHTPLVPGFCGDKEEHEIHEYNSETLGRFMCQGKNIFREIQ